MKKIIVMYLLLYSVVSFNQVTAQKPALQTGKFTVSGYVHEKGSKELLPGVPVYIPAIKSGVTTNNYGFYSITIPQQQDSVTVVFSFIGFKSITIKLNLDKDITLNVEMESSTVLKEVDIVAEHSEKVSQTSQMSSIDIPVQQIKEIPALFGEKDVLKVIQLMPGIQKGGEGSAGFYVRGGGVDQNLIILDDAPVYNAFHLFGFFSLFNGDALKSVELIKGGFPARYGGRLSSVVEMTMKDGNKEKIHGEAGVGIISSRLTLEGPLIKNKSSFLISARRTYIDVLAAPFIAAAAHGRGTAGYYFYDMNAKLNYDFGDKDKIYLSGYFGKDKFYFKEKDALVSSDYSLVGKLGWGNATATARWNHLYNNKLFSNTSFIFSNYDFITGVEENSGGDLFNLKYSSGVRDYGLKYDLNFYPSANHNIRTGLLATYHLFTPNALTVKNTSFPDENISKKTQVSGVESAMYLEDDCKLMPLLRINGGVRLSNFNTNGKNYFHAEPRFSASYNIKDDLSVKASYANMNQYIQLISNTNVGLPTDLWVPSTKNLAPQNSQQIAAGAAKDILKYDLAVTVEGYYKIMNHVLGFKEGSSFLDAGFNQDPNTTTGFNWENNVTSGKGWSYGAEFLVQRKFGKFSGWVGYTLSWTQMQFDSLNFGRKFYAKYDRRHDISVVGIYKIREMTAEKKGITLSATWVYGTGNAITLPISSYSAPIHNPGNPDSGFNNWNGSWYGDVSEYTGKNAFRMAPYHRMDISLRVTKKKKRIERTWEYSLYNAYNRKNPYFYYIETYQNGRNVLKQISLFPILPSISYNIKF